MLPSGLLQGVNILSVTWEVGVCSLLKETYNFMKFLIRKIIQILSYGSHLFIGMDSNPIADKDVKTHLSDHNCFEFLIVSL